MHKKIVGLIKKMIDESPYDFFSYDIQPNPNGDGFWKMTINFTERDNAHSEALAKSLDYIGMVYGEKLSIQTEKSIIHIS